MGRLVTFQASLRWRLALSLMFGLIVGWATAVQAADPLPAEPADEVIVTDAPRVAPGRVEVRATKAQPDPKAQPLRKAEPLAPKSKSPALKSKPLVPKSKPAVDEQDSAAPAEKEPRVTPQSAPTTPPPTADVDGAAKDGEAAAAPTEDLMPVADDDAQGAASLAAVPTDENGAVRKKVEVDPASFKGVHPGRTTAADVESDWGPPKQIKKGEQGEAQHIYKIDPFDRVSLTLVDNVVTSILILLDKPLPPDVVAKQLQMEDVEAVTVRDTRGQALGQAFPERGVLFTFAPDTDSPAVSQIVLEPVDPQSFVLRAEQHVADAYLASLEDVDYAIGLNARNARAHWVRAQILLNMGDLEAALKAAEQAVSLEPDTAEFRLLLARILARSAEFAGAVQHLEDILTLNKLSGLLKARTQLELGYCAAQAAKPNYPQALKHHQEAITLTEPLVTDERTAVRHAAKEILIAAHLGIAHDIASGRWQHKNKVVPKWLDRASAFAEEMITHDQGSIELRLRVSEGALAALAALPEPPDAQAWIDIMLQVGKDLVDSSGDVAVRQSCQWRLALALSDAMQIEQIRRQHEPATEYAKLALEMFKQAGKVGVQVPSHDYLIGRVYYRLGSMQAVDREDHKKAIAWYDKAVSLLESPMPPSALTDAGRQGETFISMAVSYWEAGGRDEALRLTRQGVQLLEKAVDESLINRAALAIPYGNLASMHEELGQAKEARKYADLAQKCERNETK